MPICECKQAFALEVDVATVKREESRRNAVVTNGRNESSLMPAWHANATCGRTDAHERKQNKAINTEDRTGPGLLLCLRGRCIVDLDGILGSNTGCFIS